MNYIKIINLKKIKNCKLIKLKLPCGSAKISPKLSLTLAPLGININNILAEYNKVNFFFCDYEFNSKNILNYFSGKLNYIVLKNINFIDMLKTLLDFPGNNNNINLDDIIFLTFFSIFEKLFFENNFDNFFRKKNYQTFTDFFSEVHEYNIEFILSKNLNNKIYSKIEKNKIILSKLEFLNLFSQKISSIRSVKYFKILND